MRLEILHMSHYLYRQATTEVDSSLEHVRMSFEINRSQIWNIGRFEPGVRLNPAKHGVHGVDKENMIGHEIELVEPAVSTATVFVPDAEERRNRLKLVIRTA